MALGGISLHTHLMWLVGKDKAASQVYRKYCDFNGRGCDKVGDAESPSAVTYLFFFFNIFT